MTLAVDVTMCTRGSKGLPENRGAGLRARRQKEHCPECSSSLYKVTHCITHSFPVFSYSLSKCLRSNFYEPGLVTGAGFAGRGVGDRPI